MPEGRVQRRLSAILSADAVGYSRLMSRNETETVRLLAACHALMSDRIGQHGGRVVDAPGDNLLAEFPSVVDAVACAVEIQRELGRRNAELPAERRLPFRIGVNLGDVVVEGERIYGDGVNVAARLESLAEPGGICISGVVHAQVKNRLAHGYEDLGEQRVKNIPEPLRAYRVRLAPEVGADAPAQAMARGRPHRTRQAVVALGAAALAAAAIGWWLRGAPSGTPGRAGPIASIAVLPLANLSADPEQDYFTDGMTEALISSLAQIGSLRVISRTSVMRYKDALEPLPAIARALQVDAVIEGSVLRAGDSVRITAQLIDARSDHHLWSESYERDLGDVLALQSAVARAVAREIELALTPAEAARLANPHRVEPRAYEAYLKGRHFFQKPTPADHAKAIGYFQEAIRLDPDYAAAWAGLADVYT